MDGILLLSSDLAATAYRRNRTNTGLYVRRGGAMILQAGNRGVTAVDVTVGNYLIVGNHARFEDFDGGTACFYI